MLRKITGTRAQECRPCKEDVLCISAVEPGLPHSKLLQAFAVGRLKCVRCNAWRCIPDARLSAIAVVDIKVQQCHLPDSCNSTKPQLTH